MQFNLFNTFIMIVLYQTLVVGDVVKTLNTRDVEPIAGTDGTPVHGLVTYTVVAFLALALLVACVFHRYRTLRLDHVRDIDLLRFLVISVYVFGICYTISGMIFQIGVGVSTFARCKAAIQLCLVFYVGNKVFLYIFLAERAHALRAARFRRLHDPVFLVSMFIILAGFGTIAVFAFIRPVHHLSPTDRICRIGLPLEVTLSLLIYDVLMNLGMAALFACLMAPYLQKDWTSYVPRCVLRSAHLLHLMRMSSEAPTPVHDPAQKRGTLEALTRRSMIASVMILIVSVANLTVLFVLGGHQQGWLCFTICTFDVAWGVIIIHWLTMSTHDLDAASAQNDLELVSSAGIRVSNE